MNPGSPLLLTCPKCGKKKQVLSLISGNNIGETIWSDQKRLAPMLPQVSIIQECPYCGKYFLSYKQKSKEHGEGFCLETGYVDYPHIKDAISELMHEDVTDNDRINILAYAIQAYNDWFYRSEDKHGRSSAEDIKFNNDNIHQLIEHLTWDTENTRYLHAELLREAGMFDEAMKILPKATDENKEFHDFIKAEQSAIQSHSTSVFIVYGPFQTVDTKMTSGSL